MSTITGQSSDQTIPGVLGDNTAQGDGVFGQGHETGRGVVGVSTQHTGVEGGTDSGIAVFGQGSETGRGVVGVSTQHTGVEGGTDSGTAVFGKATGNGAGVFGGSQNGEGVHAETHSPGVAAVAGFNLNPAGTGAAIFGKKEGQAGHAGFFSGNVNITGNLHVDGTIDGPTISQLGQAIAGVAQQLQAQIAGLEAQIAGLAAQIQAHG